MNLRTFPYSVVASLFFVQLCFSDVVWDESIDGQLSDQPGLPTLLTFSAGENLIVGDLGPNSQTQDFFWFELDADQILESIILREYDADNTSRFDMFFGPAAGTPFDGFVTTDFNAQNIGADLLSSVGAGLLPDPYSVALQEFDDPSVNYVLEINVRTVPEPATAWMAVMAGVIGLSCRRSRI